MIKHKGAALSFQPRIRKGAFFEPSWRYGCRNYSVYNRTYISSTFSNAMDEYWHVTQDVALWPVMGERQVEVSGPDAERFVEYLTPRDMSKCKVGQCKYALITSDDGGIVSDPIILKLADDRFWLSTSDSDLELWCRGVAINADMDVKIRDADVSVIQIQGPKSPKLMANLFGEEILDLKYYWLINMPFKGSDLKISRTGWSGEFGYEIYLENFSHGNALFDALMEAGAECNVAPGAVNQVRRIESGILSWGADMTLDDNPYEVRMDRLVELDKEADFIGKKSLQALKNQPLKKVIVGMEISGEQLDSNEESWEVFDEGEIVGKLTSITYSPRLKKNIALGFVLPEYDEVGQVMEVMTWDGMRNATICKYPFIPKLQNGDARDLVKKF